MLLPARLVFYSPDVERSMWIDSARASMDILGRAAIQSAPRNREIPYANPQPTMQCNGGARDICDAAIGHGTNYYNHVSMYTSIRPAGSHITAARRPLVLMCPAILD